LVSVAKAQTVPLARWAGYWTPAGSAVGRGGGLEKRRVRALQHALTGLGMRPGPVDGLFGPLTEAGVVRFQRSAGIAVDGIVGRQTARRLLAATQPASVRLARRPGGNAQRSARFASARLPRGGAFELARKAGLGASVSQLAAPGQEEEVEPGLMLALALPLLLASALLVALRGRATAARTTANATINRSLIVPAPARLRPSTTGHTANHNPRAAEPEQQQKEPEQQQKVRAVGYVSGPPRGLVKEPVVHDQIAAIAAACEQRGWQLLEIVRDEQQEGVKAPDLPGLTRVLKRMRAGQASCLVVCNLTRLSPTVVELGVVLKAIGQSGGRFVSLEDQVDTARPAGRKAANAIVTVSGWEHQRLGERTRQGLAATRTKGGPISRPSVQDVPLLKEHIADMRAQGMTLQAIADRLNQSGVPTLRGGQKWRPSSVQAAAGYRRPKR
jgi:DNA invertase Pin-like site-specific DNA recombinase